MMKNVEINEAMNDDLIPSSGWLVKLMSRNNLLLRRMTTIAQKDPSHLTDKLVGYVIHVQRLTMKGNYPPNYVIALDETAV